MFGDKMKNKQTLFGPEEKRKNDASMFFHANQTDLADTFVF